MSSGRLEAARDTVRWVRGEGRFLIASAVLLSAAALRAQDLRTSVNGYITQHRPAIVSELSALLAIPNVASDRPNIRRNADFLQRMLTSHGLRAEILETDGNPLVFAQTAPQPNLPTVLFYCHYDGQPVDRKKWTQSDPWEPIMRGEGNDARIYARSASDDKAPIVGLLAANDALTAIGLPRTVNVKLILDGEEEASSPSLVPAIGRYQDRLRADVMVILDGPGHPSGRPTIAYGARGLVTADLTVYGPKAGVHSGNYGNWIPNPAMRLAALIASMKDDRGRVTVAGYYDSVPPLTAADTAILDAVPGEDSRMLSAFGVAAPEAAFPRLQYALQYPTLNVRGLVSAFVGENARTIIPDRATAALDLRLVKETSADDLIAKLRAHIERQGYRLVDSDPDDATRATYGKLARLAVDREQLKPFRTPVEDPRARAVVASLTRTFGQPPVQLRTLGGSVPIAPFIEALGFPAILMPIVNFDNNQHEENENLRLGTFFDGIVTIAAVLRQ
jgi:acetylornithine deacetylase/succinyl-diaminopimelate desuccinylase-like protein